MEGRSQVVQLRFSLGAGRHSIPCVIDELSVTKQPLFLIRMQLNIARLIGLPFDGRLSAHCPEALQRLVMFRFI